MRHSKRRVLTTDDVNSALSARNIEAPKLTLWIISFQDSSSQPLYGFSAREPLQFKRANNSNDLFFLEDKVVASVVYRLFLSPHALFVGTWLQWGRRRSASEVPSWDYVSCALACNWRGPTIDSAKSFSYSRLNSLLQIITFAKSILWDQSFETKQAPCPPEWSEKRPRNQTSQNRWQNMCCPKNYSCISTRTVKCFGRV